MFLTEVVGASSSRHSDISLVEMGSDAVKEEDRAVLLEGGALPSASPRARSSTASSSIFRFVIPGPFFLACSNCGSVPAYVLGHLLCISSDSS